MYGLFAGFGAAARHLTRDRVLSAIKDLAPAEVDFYTNGESVSVALLSPVGQGVPIEWGRGDRLGLALDGYAVVREGADLPAQRRELARLIDSVGLLRALGMLEAGSFNLAAIDLDRATFTIANDRLASVPIYYAPTPGGCVVATAPALVATSGLVSREPDFTAVAELVFLGITVGDRYFAKAMRRLPEASTLEWNERRGQLSVSPTGLSPVGFGVQDGRPDLGAIAELVRASCRRLAGLSSAQALLLSGGMDSRLILAAWPAEAGPLPCYSYGPPEFADVAFARQVAAVRGAAFTRVPLPGEEVSEAIEEMMCLAGPPAFPNRYLAARRIAADGLDTALDGYAGDVLLGGSYYGFSRFLSRPGRWLQAINRLPDQRVGAVGLDALAEALYENIADPGAPEWLARHADADVARRLSAERPTMLQDIWTALRTITAPDGSVALAVRDFKILHKAGHSTINQAVLCRRFVRAGLPLYCDVPLLRATWRVAPRYTAFRQLYVSLFRKHFPAYAGVPYASSLLPLRSNPLAHRWAKSLRSRGLRVPLRSGARVDEKYNEWKVWLRESASLRGRAVHLLAELGLAGRAQLEAAIEPIGRGEVDGGGDLLHVAALAPLVSRLRVPA